jgi:hypothetical protein
MNDAARGRAPVATAGIRKALTVGGRWGNAQSRPEPTQSAKGAPLSTSVTFALSSTCRGAFAVTGDVLWKDIECFRLARPSMRFVPMFGLRAVVFLFLRPCAGPGTRYPRASTRPSVGTVSAEASGAGAFRRGGRCPGRTGLEKARSKPRRKGSN